MSGGFLYAAWALFAAIRDVLRGMRSTCGRRIEQQDRVLKQETTAAANPLFRGQRTDDESHETIQDRFEYLLDPCGQFAIWDNATDAPAMWEDRILTCSSRDAAHAMVLAMNAGALVPPLEDEE